MIRRGLTAALVPAFALLGCELPASPSLPGGPIDAPDAGEPDAEEPPPPPGVPPEVDGRIVINEVMVANAATIADATGNSGDWAELFNPTDQDISLHGYAMSDELGRPRKAAFRAGAVVPARGYLLVWLDDTPSRGPTHLGFKLAKDGGELGLARPDGSYIDRIQYAAQEVDLSAAREPDGSDQWVIEWHASPGAANPTGAGRPAGREDETKPPEQIAAAGDLSEQILGYDVIPELEIRVSPEGAASLEAAPKTYVPGYLVYQGRTYGPVGVRLKGQNSFLPFSQKPSLRINIDEYVEGAKFFSLDDLTLNNMRSDSSMMHERLAYRIAREAGVPAPRANHLLLTVNGQFYGLYVNVETVKRRMVARWFTDPSGPLFEATDVDFAPEYIGRYELESGRDDRQVLSGLAAALANPSPDEAIAAARAYADVDEIVRFWAMCAVVAQFDSFPYSNPGDDYFAYVDPARGVLSVIPWGMDETFYSAEYDVKQISSVFAKQCMASPACYQDFVDATWKVLEMTERMNLLAERERVMAQIAPSVARDTRKPYPTSEVNKFQQELYWFIKERRLRLQGMLPPPRP